MPYPYYGNPYYPQPMQDNLAQLRQQPMMQPAQQTQSSGVIWVQGEEGAKAYMVAPGNSVMMLDSEGSRFYIKSTDQSGMPLPLRVFDFKERAAAQQATQTAFQTAEVEYVTRKEFDALAARVGEMQGKKGEE